MSDRPDHPPVWVRGGPASYYAPPRPSISSSPGDAIRRASTASVLSTSPTEADEPFSPPPSPELASPPERATSAFALPSISATMASQAARKSQAETPIPTHPDAQQPTSARPASPDTKNRRSSSVSGAGLFSTLVSQKRVDPNLAMRRAQWQEHNVGIGPDQRRPFGSWWDK
ncbi:hypothetical protein FQN55_007387 [Onygenales sp. PD_40]|nr:hypothetical protein FQN55_007387 [Onygenales sp. PD_40]KAK2788510.1 hypothetical protein FQN52_006623 [Onygenales sp. PD_12]KAK2805434.1 hypothetical protein FQN51_000260 [Onygenales sp. PD_10]